uniref:Uncharacterized protein n=1 Tax=Cajanus cajan TaxID=3821 RepID=A0A151TDK0_CAJCA|nr:hypothetical protein KK1_019694 [Cajanus cajan]
MGPGYLGLEGIWKQDGHRIVIVNVYAPSGDHGAVDREEFNSFILDMELEDIQVVGRKFTWYRPNGMARSKLDRFLISNGWATAWPGSTQFILSRNVSDHCPILLKVANLEWGPKPFRSLDCWFQDKNFMEFVRKAWSEIHVQGTGALILKEKLKGLKGKLKQWHKDNFGNLQKQLSQVEASLDEIDKKADDRELQDAERTERVLLQEKFWSLAKRNESILRQQSRVKWMAEGDCNSKYFHSIVNWRRKQNMISGLKIAGAWVEDPQQVKEEVRNYFKDRFSEGGWRRPKMDSVVFNQITEADNDDLVKVFQESKIKEAVW